MNFLLAQFHPKGAGAGHFLACLLAMWHVACVTDATGRGTFWVSTWEIHAGRASGDVRGQLLQERGLLPPSQECCNESICGKEMFRRGQMFSLGKQTQQTQTSSIY